MPPRILVVGPSDTFAARIAGAAARLEPRPTVTGCADIVSAASILDRHPLSVLVVGPELNTREALSRLADLHDLHPGVSVVLTCDQRPRAKASDLVRTGAIDLVELPADRATLAAVLERAVAMATHLVPASAAEDELGRVYTLGSATGGCGKTFFATNLAAFLASRTGKRACVVDLDLQFGEVSTALRLKPPFTIFDVLERDSDDADLHEHIEEYLVRHDTGIWVLAAPRDPAQADNITPPDTTRILAALRARFDHVIVDTPAQLNEVVLAAFDLSDRLYTMATLDLPSIRNASVFLSTIERLKIPTDNVRLILNKAESDVGIEVEDAASLFPGGFSAVIPYAKEASRSINQGMPVIAGSPDAHISRCLAASMVDLLPDGEREQVDLLGIPATRSASLFRRLFRRAVAA